MEMQDRQSYGGGGGGGGGVLICYFIIVFFLNARLHKTNNITIHSFHARESRKKKSLCYLPPFQNSNQQIK